MFGALANKIEKFSADRLSVIVGCALAAGLSIPIAWFSLLRISVLWRINTPSWTFIIKSALVCISCYMAAALLLILAKAHRKTTFSWIFVAVLGSFILAISDVWQSPASMPLTASDFISGPVKDLLEKTLWLSLFTMLFTALVRYSGSIVRALTCWHTGRDYSLSILGE